MRITRLLLLVGAIAGCGAAAASEPSEIASPEPDCGAKHSSIQRCVTPAGGFVTLADGRQCSLCHDDDSNAALDACTLGPSLPLLACVADCSECGGVNPKVGKGIHGTLGLPLCVDTGPQQPNARLLGQLTACPGKTDVDDNPLAACVDVGGRAQNDCLQATSGNGIEWHCVAACPR